MEVLIRNWMQFRKGIQSDKLLVVLFFWFFTTSTQNSRSSFFYKFKLITAQKNIPYFSCECWSFIHLIFPVPPLVFTAAIHLHSISFWAIGIGCLIEHFENDIEKLVHAFYLHHKVNINFYMYWPHSISFIFFLMEIISGQVNYNWQCTMRGLKYLVCSKQKKSNC